MEIPIIIYMKFDDWQRYSCPRIENINGANRFKQGTSLSDIVVYRLKRVAKDEDR
jgi:hypothetical protein